MSTLAWLLPSGLLGWALMGATIGRPQGADLSFALIPCVALGAAAAGLLHYGLLATLGHTLPGVEVGLAAGFAVVAFRRPPLPAIRLDVGRRVGPIALGLALVLCALVITSLAVHHVHPHGEWDAWDFWVMRARALVRLGDGWRSTYSPILYGAHPRYPPLWSMTIARAWTLSNDEAQVTPYMISLLHALGAISLLGWAVARARGLAQGLIAAVTLAALPNFATQSAWQYADIPLSFHLLGAVAALTAFERERHLGWLVLAGVFAGFAPLTKNEGGLFLLVFVFALLVVKRPSVDRRTLGSFAVGVAPAAIALLHFRAFVAPEHGGSSEDFLPEWDEGLAAMAQHAITRTTEASNWVDLYRGSLGSLWNDGGLVPIVVALPVLLLLAGWSSSRAPRSLRATWLALGLYVVAIEVSFVALSLWRVIDHVVELYRLVLVVTPIAMFATFCGAWPRRSSEPNPSQVMSGPTPSMRHSEGTSKSSG